MDLTELSFCVCICVSQWLLVYDSGIWWGLTNCRRCLDVYVRFGLRTFVLILHGRGVDAFLRVYAFSPVAKWTALLYRYYMLLREELALIPPPRYPTSDPLPSFPHRPILLVRRVTAGYGSGVLWRRRTVTERHLPSFLLLLLRRRFFGDAAASAHRRWQQRRQRRWVFFCWCWCCFRVETTEDPQRLPSGVRQGHATERGGPRAPVLLFRRVGDGVIAPAPAAPTITCFPL